MSPTLSSNHLRDRDLKITGPARASGPSFQFSGAQLQQSDRAGAAACGSEGVSLEIVTTLHLTAKRRKAKALASVVQESPELVDRKVKALLNKLTLENFDSISDQIIAWANKSEKEIDGPKTLIRVICLIFEKATDEAIWSEVYATLCRKMMSQISPRVLDEGIKNSRGKPLVGGQLFHKHLLNICRENFDRGWVTEEASAATAMKTINDQADTSQEYGDVALYSDEYYAAHKEKRRGLGLVKFIGELFKLHMLRERIMHKYLSKLIRNTGNPQEVEIESLCKLLTTVGSKLDTAKGLAQMDSYFELLKEWMKNPLVSSRSKFMLQDVIELRERTWQ
ncbi:armadillo-type protein [Lentinula raphanica]|nr:armadillo-type protein [Lentinula raphanica]